MHFPQKPHFSLNIYGLLIWRLLLSLSILTLCRIIFLWYNADLLNVVAGSWAKLFLGGLKFDLAALVYINGLAIMLHLLPLRRMEGKRGQQFMAWCYFIPNLLALIANLADTVYFRFTLNRTSMAVFREFANDNPFRFIRLLIDYPVPAILFVLIASVWIWLYQRAVIRPLLLPCSARLLATTGIAIITGGLCFGAVRGGYGDLRPLAPHNAALYCNEPQQQALVLNTPFTLLRTIGKRGMKVWHYFPDREAKQYFTAVRPTTTDGAFSGKFQGRNVVVIIWESMSKEWVGGLNPNIPGYPSYTPFIDSLLPQAYVFTQAYACGTQSVDAMPALFCSITRPAQPFVTSPYSGNSLTSLPQILHANGYHTAFFHNAENGSMGFDAFAKKIGFQDYYGQREYGDMRDLDKGGWGIWDEPFLQYMAQQLNSFRQPFFATEFTISSHHPFHVPTQYKEMLPKGSLPIQQCIAYTDMSLRKFFETARKCPWYNHTLFIITADHAVTGARPEYKNLVGRFSIPFILYAPEENFTGRNATTFQQSDLLPTLLDLLGIRQTMVSFGHNVFSPSSPHFAVNSAGEMYQMIEGNYVLHFNGEQVTGFYDKKQDPNLKHNLAHRPPAEMKKMLRTLKAYLQEFTQRMTKNQLTLRNNK